MRKAQKTTGGRSCQRHKKPRKGEDTKGTIRPWKGEDTKGTIRPWKGEDTKGTIRLWKGEDTKGTIRPWKGEDTKGTIRLRKGEDTKGTIRPWKGEASADKVMTFPLHIRRMLRPYIKYRGGLGDINKNPPHGRMGSRFLKSLTKSNYDWAKVSINKRTSPPTG
jgi:hypothetical protein